MIRALSLYGYVVSFLSCCLSYDLGGRAGAALWHRDRSVASVHQPLRRSWARHEDDWSATPTGYLSGLCCSRGGTRAKHDSHSDLADRAGVSVGTEDFAYKSRRQLGRLGRCGSLGSTITESEGYKCNWFHGTAVDTYHKERKLKMTQVLDQGDDTEFTVEPESMRATWTQRVVALTGGYPQPEEEPTLEQLSALYRRTAIQDMGPYADFGVFVPFGSKALKASKFRTYVLTADGYVTKELQGPANFTQWKACYKVYMMALLMLNIADQAVLYMLTKPSWRSW